MSYVLIIVGSFLVLSVPVLSWSKRITANAAWVCFLGAVFCFTFANVDKLESFKASKNGFEAQMRKIQETTEIASAKVKELELLEQQLSLAYTPAIAITFQDGKFRVYNDGVTSIWLSDFESGVPFQLLESNLGEDHTPRMIAPNTYYYFNDVGFLAGARAFLGTEKEKLVPCKVGLTNALGKKYIAHCKLLLTLSGDSISVDPQLLDVSAEGETSQQAKPDQAPST